MTSSMLLKDANFSGTVSNHGGKGLVSVLRKEAGKLGLGGNAASRDVFWRVNAKGSPCSACMYACYIRITLTSACYIRITLTSACYIRITLTSACYIRITLTSACYIRITLTSACYIRITLKSV